MARSHLKNTSGSESTVYVALAGNTLVALSKFAAAWWTGSSAMLSEGIHSLVDTGNELLLLYGLHRGRARPDPEHPLGYGREIYFWSFVVALLIFTLGAGASLYEGVIHILEPHPIEDPIVTYVVLALSFLFEGASWIYTVRKFKGSMRYGELFRAVRRSKDPPTFIVLLEDSAALIGLLIAFIGVYLSVRLQSPVIDGLASIFIGLTLAATAAILARETKGLLIGERASQRTLDSILSAVQEVEGVTSANGALTVHLSPNEILVALSLEFDDNLKAPQIEVLVVELERRIRQRQPDVVVLFVKPQTLARFRDSAARHFGAGGMEAEAAASPPGRGGRPAVGTGPG